MNVEKFCFYSMEERTPPKGVPVLVKFDDHIITHAVIPKYYVCYYMRANPDFFQSGYCFREASGEEYMKLDPAHVIGWASIGMEKI